MSTDVEPRSTSREGASYRRWLKRSACAMSVLTCLAAVAQVDPRMINAEPVRALASEERGLVTLTTPAGSCSATLLDNLWAITAAHCVDDLIGAGMLGVPPGVTLTANWDISGAQVRTVERIVSYQPLDVAIVRVTQPFRVQGSERVTFKLDGAIGEQHLTGHRIEMYGRGISQWASGAGASATPTMSSGEYRRGLAVYSRATHNLNWFNSTSTGAVAGGDSGGSSFIQTQSGRLLAGVHAMCLAECVPGKSCTAGDAWRWVKATTECADAPVLPVWPQIRAALNSPAAPKWDRMTVQRYDRAVDYLRPTIQVDRDFYRLDVCREWGANCGKPAADAFCAAHEKAFREAVSFKVEDDFGHTAVISNGQLCFGPHCDTFASIRCGLSGPTAVDRARESGSMSVFRPEPAQIATQEPSGIAGVLQSQSTRCKPGYVWRTARPEDLVCVTSASRAQAREENRVGPSFRQ
jgi:hypothetical protein